MTAGTPDTFLVAFWAPTALGGLDFSKDPQAKLRADDVLLRMLASRAKTTFKPGPTLDDGLAFLHTPRVVAVWRRELKSGENAWQVARAIATARETSLLPEVLGAALRTLNAGDLDHLMNALISLKTDFPKAGLDDKEVFTRLVARAYEFEHSGSILVSLVLLRPAACEVD